MARADGGIQVSDGLFALLIVACVVGVLALLLVWRGNTGLDD